MARCRGRGFSNYIFRLIGVWLHMNYPDCRCQIDYEVVQRRPGSIKLSEACSDWSSGNNESPTRQTPRPHSANTSPQRSVYFLQSSEDLVFHYHIYYLLPILRSIHCGAYMNANWSTSSPAWPKKPIICHPNGAEKVAQSLVLVPALNVFPALVVAMV